MQISTHPTCHLETRLGTKDLKHVQGEKHLIEIFTYHNEMKAWLQMIKAFN